jgi:hypothetical protein
MRILAAVPQIKKDDGKGGNDTNEKDRGEGGDGRGKGGGESGDAKDFRLQASDCEEENDDKQEH